MFSPLPSFKSKGLLSLYGFTTDLQRKCWVQAMLTPPRKSGKVGGEGGEATASSVTDIAKGKHTVEGATPWFAIFCFRFLFRVNHNPRVYPSRGFATF